MQLDQITFTRFVAALTVVFFHYGQTVFPANISLLFENVTAGPIAVGYFYVLSGFIMAIAYYQPQQDVTSQLNGFERKKYWIARFARIYPVYLLGLLIIVAAKFRSLSADFEMVPLHLSMLQAWIPGYPITLNTPGWSISVEAFFYLAFPFLLAFIHKSGTRKLLYATLLLWLLTQGVLHIAINSTAYVPKNELHDLVYYNPAMHLNSFMAGLLAGVYFKRNSNTGQSGQGIWLLVSFLVVVLLIGLRPELERISGYQIAYTNGLITPAFLFFILMLCRDQGMVARLFKHKWLILLGEASYSLYILQKPVYGLYDRLVVPRISLNETIHFYLFLLLLIIISIASFRYFETPMRRYLRRKLS